MSELAFNLNGEPFEVPDAAVAWRVRRLKRGGRRRSSMEGRADAKEGRRVVDRLGERFAGLTVLRLGEGHDSKDGSWFSSSEIHRLPGCATAGKRRSWPRLGGASSSSV
jgi:hypothetical protein